MTTQPTRGRDPAQPSSDLSYEITFPADARRIATVVDCVVELLRRAGAEPDKEMEVTLALTEALANAVRHGSNNDPGKSVACCASVDGNRELTIVVRDSGPGFDPTRLPDPTRGDGITADHGRGIYMIRQLMDEVRFEHHGTELQMKKNL